MPTRTRISMQLGRWILEARKKLGYSRARVKINGAHLYRIETKGLVPRLGTLLKIADSLGIDSETKQLWLQEAGYQARPPLATQEEPDEANADPSAAHKAVRLIADTAESLMADDIARLSGKLSFVVEHVEAQWSTAPIAEMSRFIVAHGPERHMGMIKSLCKNFRNEIKTLKPDEIWLLLAAVWLHDIGLTKLPDTKSPEFLTELARYHELSRSYVDNDDLQAKLGLSRDDRRVLVNLCRYQRNRDRLPDLEIAESGSSASMSVDRQKVVLALLRLAALIEVDQKRVASITPLRPAIPTDLESELIRNLFLTRIERHQHTLRADFCYPRLADSDKVTALQKRLEDDLQRSLDSVKDVLVLYCRSTLLSVAVNPGEPPSDHFKDRLNHQLDLLNVNISPNAGLVIDTLIAALEKFLEDQPSARHVSTLREQIFSELDAYVSLRPYQAQIANFTDDLRRALGDPSLDEAAQISQARSIIRGYRERKEKAYLSIQEASRSLLEPHREFFLYGFSQAVLRALSGLRPDKQNKCRVSVFECRPKSDHGPDGNLVYCDGIAYARKLTGEWEATHVWPDSAACWAIGNGKKEGRSPAVLLGAEGIADGTGDVLSTIGTMVVVLAAKHLNVPVYVFAETGKIRPNLEEKGGRGNRWLTSFEREPDLTGARRIDIQNFANELVPSAYVSKIVSEEEPLAPQALIKRVASLRKVKAQH